jgi:glycosyltransferase involved in cell wall biosynthesis
MTTADTLKNRKNDGKINVLYLNHSEQTSGAEQSLRALLWQLRREGREMDPVVALPAGGSFSQLLRDEGWNVTFAPLRRLQRPHNMVGTMRTLLHIMRTAPFITKLARDTRAHLIHSNSTTAHLVGGWAGNRRNIPALWHVRDLVPLGHVAPALASRAACVIAISGCVAEQLQKDGVPPDKIRVIHNGLDPMNGARALQAVCATRWAWKQAPFSLAAPASLCRGKITSRSSKPLTSFATTEAARTPTSPLSAATCGRNTSRMWTNCALW